MKANRVLTGSVLALLLLACVSAEAKTVRFADRTWNVRVNGRGGPGPNNWSDSDSNVFVDANGYLHLKITQVKNKWYCAEVFTNERLGFGRYQFQTGSRVDTLDPNVVLGLFNYPTGDVGPDGTNEIDIEYARWGNAAWPNGNFTVWPTKTTLSHTTNSFEFNLTGNDSTHRFLWNSTSVNFKTFNGLVAPLDETPTPIASWNYAPTDFADRISISPMPVHLNLWLFNGLAPKNKVPVEIIIKSFTFTP